jgi:hypothetical protein
MAEQMAACDQTIMDYVGSILELRPLAHEHDLGEDFLVTMFDMFDPLARRFHERMMLDPTSTTHGDRGKENHRLKFALLRFSRQYEAQNSVVRDFFDENMSPDAVRVSFYTEGRLVAAVVSENRVVTTSYRLEWLDD